MATQYNHPALKRFLDKRPDTLDDKRALKDSIQHHNELLDRLSNEMMVLKSGGINADTMRAELEMLRSLAKYHRDVIDCLTDVVERISKHH